MLGLDKVDPLLKQCLSVSVDVMGEGEQCFTSSTEYVSLGYTSSWKFTSFGRREQVIHSGFIDCFGCDCFQIAVLDFTSTNGLQERVKHVQMKKEVSLKLGGV